MIEALGYIAGVFIVLSFLPQVVRSYRTHGVRDLSLAMILATLIGTLLWITYGALTADPPIVVMNTVFGVFVVMLLYLKLRYDR